MTNPLSRYDITQPLDIPSEFTQRKTKSVYFSADKAHLIYLIEEVAKVLRFPGLNEAIVEGLELWIKAHMTQYIEKKEKEARIIIREARHEMKAIKKGMLLDHQLDEDPTHETKEPGLDQLLIHPRYKELHHDVKKYLNVAANAMSHRHSLNREPKERNAKFFKAVLGLMEEHGWEEMVGLVELHLREQIEEEVRQGLEEEIQDTGWNHYD